MYEISKEENGGVNGVFEVPNLCMVTLEGEFQMVRNWGAKCLRNMKKPKLTNGKANYFFFDLLIIISLSVNVNAEFFN